MHISKFHWCSSFSRDFGSGFLSGFGKSSANFPKRMTRDYVYLEVAAFVLGYVIWNAISSNACLDDTEETDFCYAQIGVKVAYRGIFSPGNVIGVIDNPVHEVILIDVSGD